MKTITIQPTNQPTNPPQQNTSSNFIPARGAVIVGGFFFLGVFGVGLLALYALPVFTRWPLALIPGGLWLALSLASILGMVWTSWDVAGAWAVDLYEYLTHRKAQAAETAAPLPPIPAELNTGERIAYAARVVLELHYIEQLKATRAECEGLGISQPLWNTVNKIYNAVGIKSGNDWQMDYMQALTALRSVRIEENGAIWVKHGTGQKRII